MKQTPWWGAKRPRKERSRTRHTIKSLPSSHIFSPCRHPASSNSPFTMSSSLDEMNTIMVQWSLNISQARDQAFTVWAIKNILQSSYNKCLQDTGNKRSRWGQMRKENLEARKLTFNDFQQWHNGDLFIWFEGHSQHQDCDETCGVYILVTQMNKKKKKVYSVTK